MENIDFLNLILIFIFSYLIIADNALVEKFESADKINNLLGFIRNFSQKLPENQIKVVPDDYAIKVDKLWVGTTPGKQFLIEWVPSSKKLKVSKVDPPS
jgi:hypothetical protein